MTKPKQHLFLFFEENEYQFNISSNLVRLSMNRCVVNEDSQTEVIGTFYLKRLKKDMINFRDGNPEYKNSEKERAEKEAFDKNLILQALNRAATTTKNEFVNSQFIFGSHFHPLHIHLIHPQPGLFDYRTIFGTYRKASSRLFEWISHEMKKLNLESLQCTMYKGTRSFLMSKEMSVAYYANRMTVRREEGSRFTEEIPPSSGGVSSWCIQCIFSLDNFYICIVQHQFETQLVNDDLEKLILNAEKNIQPSEFEDLLFLHKMLTTKELQQVNNNDARFWDTISNINNTKDPYEKRDYTVAFEDHDKKDKYLYCSCLRFTIMLK